MKRSLLPILYGLSVLAVSAGAGHTQSNNGSGKAPQLANTPNLIAPFAQAVAQVSADGSVISSKGIKSVSRPTIGQLCIELAGGIVVRTVPVVSVDWSESNGDGLLAYWRSTSSGCPGATRRTINIITYRLEGGVPVLTNEVGVVVVVP